MLGIILVVLGSFAAAFFLIPREPCVATERMTANSAGYNPSTGDFEVYLHLFIKFQSFSYLDMGFNELAVNLTDAASVRRLNPPAVHFNVTAALSGESQGGLF
ncbi:hypothetical protein FNF29_07624 [Cafeteria roenbergensis]|uniref:Uncharacterized protein n=1 Tax=Cafeteria roenbergensis TaxID=33653 RepID=A0A5A8C2W2_CAFRO|nr:hypothetical protein FNF29_07624 [Cafeteria roenbergensis]|eukprot:KAA0146997.1 hypothetical protein FNF29_07624 [Cafeteria roenbergensis]